MAMDLDTVGTYVRLLVHTGGMWLKNKHTPNNYYRQQDFEQSYRSLKFLQARRAMGDD